MSGRAFGPAHGARKVASKSAAEITGSGGTVGVVLVHDIFGRATYLRSVAEALAELLPAANRERKRVSVELYSGSVTPSTGPARKATTPGRRPTPVGARSRSSPTSEEPRRVPRRRVK